MIVGSSHSHVFFTFGRKATTKPTRLQASAFTFTDQFKISSWRKERKKKILVYVEEYLQEVPLS